MNSQQPYIALLRLDIKSPHLTPSPLWSLHSSIVSYQQLPGPSTLMDFFSEGSLTLYNYARRWISKNILGRFRRPLITSDMLSDDVLLEIFHFYVDVEFLGKQGIEEWIALAHVCRRWRSVVFQSPRRLNLRLVCTSRTSASDIGIWPPLPLVINDWDDIIDSEHRSTSTPSVDNVVAALEHNDRVCQISLMYLECSLKSERVSSAMQKPFPELTHLSLGFKPSPGSILPDSFLNGTAPPRLRSLTLDNVPFPGLPKLLLSTTRLVNLFLNIPPSGYIPPEELASSLSALDGLASLTLQFRSPRPRPALESRRPPPPPPTRSILPSLAMIIFKGASEYLDEILARIDAPRLSGLYITFFNQIMFDTPRLVQFISRRPTMRAPERGHIEFNPNSINITFSSQTSDYMILSVEILCTTSEWQLSSLEHVCTSSLPPLSALEDLYIFEDQDDPSRWQDDFEDTLWLDLLRSFVAVKNLYLSEEFAPRIASAFQELVEGRTTEVLPTLENIFLEGFQSSGPLHEGIEKFVTARRLTSHPAAVSPLHRERRRDFFGW